MKFQKNLRNSSNSSSEIGNTNQSHPVQISPAKHWIFTWNNYSSIDPDNLLLALTPIAKRWQWQPEVGESGTPHLQGYVEFLKKMRPGGLASSAIHWEKCNNIEASIAYCCKDDTRAGEVVRGGVWPLTKESRAIALDILPRSLLKPWHEEVLNIIGRGLDRRSIYWFWEPCGEVWKSAFAAYLVHWHDAYMVGGKNADMKTAIATHVKNDKKNGGEGLGPPIIVIDVPMDSKDYISYTGIEELKNGTFFSPKYESGMVQVQKPHVFVFANIPPNEERMGKNRFKVTELSLEG